MSEPGSTSTRASIGSIAAIFAAYAIVVAAFVWVADGVQSVAYPENLTIGLSLGATDQTFGEVFLVVIPVATILAAKFLYWPHSLLLPIVFLGIAWQAIVPCSRCESISSSYELVLVAWALLVVLPISILASAPRNLDHDSRLSRPLVLNLASVSAYFALAFVTSTAPVKFDELFGRDASLVGEISSPIGFTAVSVLGSFVVGSRIARPKALALPFVFLVAAAIGSSLPIGDLTPEFLLAWTALVVVPSVLAGAASRAFRERRDTLRGATGL